MNLIKRVRLFDWSPSGIMTRETYVRGRSEIGGERGNVMTGITIEKSG